MLHRHGLSPVIDELDTRWLDVIQLLQTRKWLAVMCAMLVASMLAALAVVRFIETLDWKTDSALLALMGAVVVLSWPCYCMLTSLWAQRALRKGLRRWH